MNPRDAFQRILASLHRATLDDAHWPAIAALIDEACGVAGNGLAVSGGSGDDARILYAGASRRGERHPVLESEYFDTYYPHDERVPRLGNQNGLNVCFHEPHGLRIVWAIADPVATGGWQSAQLQMIAYLLPHIRQFVRVRQALAAADDLGASLTGLLDNGRIGVLHLDRSCRLLAVDACRGPDGAAASSDRRIPGPRRLVSPGVSVSRIAPIGVPKVCRREISRVPIACGGG